MAAKVEALYAPAAKESKREGNSRGGKSNKSTANLQLTSRPKIDATAKAAEQLNVSPRNRANRIIKWHGKRELVRMRTSSFLPANERQWVAVEGVPDEKLPDVPIAAPAASRALPEPCGKFSTGSAFFPAFIRSFAALS